MARVFISYGHDASAPFAQRLKHDLDVCGHDTWFDLDRLKPGGDWERYIAEGLDWLAERPGAGWLVLLMTPHSVRRADKHGAPAGYCLNELARAIERNVPIVPVMLIDCEPPLSICRLQWLDMRRCSGGDEYAGPYPAALAQLNGVLEGSLALDVDGAQARLVQRLKPLALPAMAAGASARFIGRDWLFQAIDDWLAKPDGPRVFWITGAPGVGKTALATQLCAQLRAIAGQHFCTSGDDRRTDARRCAMSLAYQLCTQLPELRDRLVRSDLDRLLEWSPRTVISTLLCEPLGDGFPDPLRPVVLLIDGLDEASSGQRNEMAEMLAAAFEELPRWLRFILTSRPGAAVSFPLQGLEPCELDPASDSNRSDVRQYIRREMSPFSASGKIADTTIAVLEAASQGLFLYLHHVREDLAAKRLSLERPQEFPRGLRGVYSRFFQRQFPDTQRYGERVRPVLEVVLAAAEPLDAPLLKSLFCWTDYDESALHDELKPLFEIREGRVDVFHATVREWLVDRAGAGPFLVSPVAGHRRLAEFGWTRYTRQQALPPYLLKYLTRHLREAGRQAELETALADWSFAITRCAAGLATIVVGDFDALPRSAAPALDTALRAFIETSRHAAPFLGSGSEDTLSRLELSAMQLGLSEVRRRLSERAGTRAWWPLWTRARRVSPHRIVARNGSYGLCVVQSRGHTALLAWDRGFSGRSRLWDLQTGQTLGPAMGGHGVRIHGDTAGGLNSMAASGCPQDHRLASGGADQRVRTWDVRTGREIGCSVELGDEVSQLAWTMLEERPVVVALAGAAVHLLDAADLAPLAAPYSPATELRSACFAVFDDRVLLVTLDEARRVSAFDVVTQRPFGMAIASSGDLELACATLDGRLVVATAGPDHKIRVHSMTDAAEPWPVIDVGEETVLSLFVGEIAHRPVLMAGTYGQRVHLWDLTTGKPLTAPMEGHTSSVTSVLLACIEGVAVPISGSIDGTVRRWQLGHGASDDAEPALADVSTVCLGSIGSRTVAVFGRPGEVVQIDAGDGQTSAAPLRWPGSISPIAVAVVPVDGGRVLAAYWGGGLVQWWAAPTEPAEVICQFPFNNNALVCTQVAGRWLLAGAGTDAGAGFVSIYELATRRLRLPREPMVHSAVSSLCAASVDGVDVLFSIGGGWIRRWRLPSGDMLGETAAPGVFFAKHPLVCQIAGKMRLLCAERRFIHVFDASSGALAMDPVPAHRADVTALACYRSAHTEAIVSAGSDGTLKVWDPRTFRCWLQLELDDWIRGLAIEGDDLVVAAARGPIALRLQPECMRQACRKGRPASSVD